MVIIRRLATSRNDKVRSLQYQSIVSIYIQSAGVRPLHERCYESMKGLRWKCHDDSSERKSSILAIRLSFGSCYFDKTCEYALVRTYVTPGDIWREDINIIKRGSEER